MLWRCGISYSCLSVLPCCLSSTPFSSLLSLLFTHNFLGVVLLCSLKDLRPRPPCCSFPRVPSSRLLPACTLKYLHHLPAVEIFHAFLPSTLLMFEYFSALSTWYLIPDMYEKRSFVFLFCFSFVLVFLFVFFWVLCASQSLLPCAPKV